MYLATHHGTIATSSRRPFQDRYAIINKGVISFLVSSGNVASRILHVGEERDLWKDQKQLLRRPVHFKETI